MKAVTAEQVGPALKRGAPTLRDADVPQRFKIGDKVRVRHFNPPTHTRAPRYVRGHTGIVDRVHGPHVFPDSHARGEGENPRILYSVRFAARELWGPDGSTPSQVYVDLWDDYLEPA